MSYTSNIPQAPDNPSNSQGLILNNFLAISSAFNLNHENFNDATPGKHTLVNWVRQSLPQSSNAEEGLLFCALSAVSAATELFYGRDENTAVQMTGIRPTTGGPGTSFSWDFVDGLGLRFGQVEHTGVSTSIAFQTAFSDSAFVVVFSPIGAAVQVSNTNVQFLTKNGFSFNSSSSAPDGSLFFYNGSMLIFISF